LNTLKAVIALSLFIWVGSTLVLAQNFPSLNNGVADSTGRLDASEVRAAIGRLERGTGAEAIALAYDNKSGIGSNAYEMQFLQRHNLANSSGDIRNSLIIIAIDYESREIKIRYGDDWTSALDSRVQSIQDRTIVPQALNNPTRAFVAGFEAILAAIVPPAPSSGSGGGLSFWGVVLLFLIVLGTIFASIKLWPIYRQRQQLLEKIEQLREQTLKANVDLTIRLAIDAKHQPDLAYLMLIYNTEAVDRAKQLGIKYDKHASMLGELRKANVQLDAESYNLLTKTGVLSSLIRDYEKVETRQKGIENWLKELFKEREAVETLVKKTQHDLIALQVEVEQTRSSYVEAAKTVNHLPEADRVFGFVEQGIEKLETLIEQNRWLSAAEVPSALRHKLELLQQTFEKILIATNRWQEAIPALRQTASTKKNILRIEDIVQGAQQQLMHASGHLEDGDWEDALGQAELVDEHAEQIIPLLTSFVDALDQHEDNLSAIQVMETKGYRRVIDDELIQYDAALHSAQQALQSADLEQAEIYLADLKAVSESALRKMQLLETLRAENNYRIKSLAERVSELNERYSDKIEPKWHTLLQSFQQKNWSEVDGHFEQAGALIQGLFDDPNDAADRVSQIESLNDLTQQQCGLAGQRLDQAYLDLSSATHLLDQIESQHKKVHLAKENHQKALNKARVKLQQARDLRDGSDRLIGAEVDQLIDQAAQALLEAEHATKQLIYVDVLGFSQQVHDLCDQAIAMSQNQIANIHNVIQEKESEKFNSRGAIEQLQQILHNAPSAVQTEMAFEKLNQVQSKIDTATAHEIQALTLEDHAMADAEKQSMQAYREVNDLVVAANEQFNEALKAYAVEKKKARDAVKKASVAVQEAKRRCRDHRARRVGMDKFKAAFSMLPKMPSDDDSYAELNSIAERAKEAQHHAEQATKAALVQIQAYEKQLQLERRRQATYTSDWWGPDYDEGEIPWFLGGGGTRTTRSSGNRSRSGRSSSGGGRSSGGRSYGGGGSSSRSSFGGSSSRSSSHGKGGSSSRSGF
jgi:uncharacterized membrane protein YgcG